MKRHGDESVPPPVSSFCRCCTCACDASRLPVRDRAWGGVRQADQAFRFHRSALWAAWLATAGVFPARPSAALLPNALLGNRAPA